MAQQSLIRWTDISVEKTSLKRLIQLLNLRLGRLGKPMSFGRGEVVFCADGTPDPIVPGGIMYLPFPKFDAQIDGWTLVADAAGDLEIDIFKAAYPAIPTAAESIVAAAPPALAAAQIDRAVSVPTWNGRINAEDTLGFEIVAASGITRFTLSLSIEKL